MNNKRSDSCNVLSGVLQGTNHLGPFTFFIYINDLPLHVSNKVCLYADDVILYSYNYVFTLATNFKSILTPSCCGHTNGKYTLIQGSVNS